MALTKITRLLETGQFLAASHAFLAALQDPEITSPRDLAQLYFMGGNIRSKLGHLHSALELTRIAEQKAIEAGDPVILGKIWFNLVEHLRATGDTSEALEYGIKFLDNLGMYPELARYTALCHFNVGLCYRQRKNNPEAIRHYRLAAQLVNRGNNPQLAGMVSHNLAWLLLELGRMDEADVEIANSFDLLDEENTHGRRMYLLLTAYRHYHARDYEAARQICEEFLVPGVDATHDQRFWALWICGMMYAAVGRQDLAQTFWLMANDSALKTGEPRLLNRAGELRASFLQRT